MFSLIILIMTAVVMVIAGNVYGLSLFWLLSIAVIGALLSIIFDHDIWI